MGRCRGLLLALSATHGLLDRLTRSLFDYLSRLLRLPSLAPDVVTAIINGKHPPELSAKRLTRLALKLPTDWAEQRKLLGFSGNRARFAHVAARCSLMHSCKNVDPQILRETFALGRERTPLKVVSDASIGI